MPLEKLRPEKGRATYEVRIDAKGSGGGFVLRLWQQDDDLWTWRFQSGEFGVLNAATPSVEPDVALSQAMAAIGVIIVQMGWQVNGPPAAGVRQAVLGS